MSLIECRDELKALIRSSKIAYFSKVINENQRDQSRLFRVAKTMLHSKKTFKYLLKHPKVILAINLTTFLYRKLRK